MHCSYIGFIPLPYGRIKLNSDTFDQDYGMRTLFESERKARIEIYKKNWRNRRRPASLWFGIRKAEHNEKSDLKLEYEKEIFAVWLSGSRRWYQSLLSYPSLLSRGESHFLLFIYQMTVLRILIYPPNYLKDSVYSITFWTGRGS